MKKLQIILLTIVSMVAYSCTTPSKEEIQTARKRPYGISLIHSSYELDTTVILSNSNLEYLIRELENTELKPKHSYTEMPKAIRIFLDSLTGGFDIADPEKAWQAGCVSITTTIETQINDSIVEISSDPSDHLPSRQLEYLGIGTNIVLMTYYTGGIGKAAHTLILKYQEGRIIDLWLGNAPYDINNKSEVLEFIKMNNNAGALNTHNFYF